MHILGNITHPDPVIDRKAKFFRDWFEYLSQVIGKSQMYPLENHLYLIENALFRWEGLEKKTQIVTELSKHALFQPEDFYTQRYLTKEFPKLRHWLSNPSEESEAQLQKVKDFLDTNYVNHCFSEMSGHVFCHHELEYQKHPDYIKYYTRMMVARLYFAGFLQEDFVGFQTGIFDRLLSFTYTEENGKVYTKFILPRPILDLKGTDQFAGAVRDYFAERGSVKQFSGMTNLLEYPHEAFECWFLLENVEIKNSVTSEIRGKLRVAYQIVKPSERYYMLDQELDELHKASIREFLNRPDTLLLIVNVTGITRKQVTYNALRESDRIVNTLNSIWGADISLHADQHFEFIDGRLSGYNFRHSKKTIHSWDVEKLHALNSSACQILQKADEAYFHALRSKDPEVQLMYLWVYLERCFPHFEEKPQEKADKICTSISIILLLDEEKTYRQEAELLLINWLNNTHSYDPEILGLSIKEQVLRNRIERHDLGVAEIKKMTTYFTVQEKIREYTGYTLDKGVFQYYKRLLQEAHRSRNNFVHSNLSHPATLIRLSRHLPEVVRRFRKIVQAHIIEDLPVDKYRESI